MKRSRPAKTTEKVFRRKLTGQSQTIVVAIIKVASDKQGKKTGTLKRATVQSLYDNFEAQSDVMTRAKLVQEKLSPKNPSLLKVMLPSHVTGGFWLGLPKQWCVTNLPKLDVKIVLEDEEGEEHEIKYLSEKVGLSAGWRGFSIAHKLMEGDIVIFHLVKPSKMKVYIVRSNHTTEFVDALTLSKTMASRKTEIAPCHEKKDIIPYEKKEYEEPVLHLPDIHNEIPFPQIESDNEDLGSEGVDGIRLSESTIDFNQVRSITDFNIILNGLVIDFEFSQHLKSKYYELCSSQKTYLHGRLLEGLNCKLVSGIISETINIADAIEACKISTPQDYMETWDKTLEAFEVLGMTVGFLRVRLNNLIGLAKKSKKASKEEIV